MMTESSETQAGVQVTVIICTHNPNRAYLERVFKALSAQTLDSDCWKVALVDNASDPAVEDSLLESFGVPGVVLHEAKSGKVNAMAHAAKAVEGNWVVFMDDDNVPDHKYLEQVLRIGNEFPHVGVLSASIEGEFESDVPDWLAPYLSYLAIRPLEKAVWANFQGPLVPPVGAGMCVRVNIYQKFVESYRSGGFDPSLGRAAGSLAAGTDDTAFMDLAFSLGLGCGAFPELQLTHLMPDRRIQPEYVARLVKDITRAHTILKLRRRRVNPIRRCFQVCEIASKVLFAKGPEVRRIEWARMKGFREGMRG